MTVELAISSLGPPEMSGRRPVDAAAFRLPRPSPLGLTCPSWSPGRVAWVRMGWHPPRSAFRRPSGPHRVTWPSVHRHSAKLRRPSEGAHRGLLISPSEIRPTGPRPTAPVPKDRCPAELPLLGFSFPTTHVGPGDPRMAGDPSPAACRVQGLVTLFATSTPVPSDTSTPLRAQRTLAGTSCRSVHGIPPSRRFPRRGRYSSRSPCPPGVRRAVRPPDHGGRARPLSGPRQASSPPGLRSHDGSVRSPRQYARAADAFLGFSPPELAPLRAGAGFRSRAPPLSSLRGLTFRPAWASGSRATEESDDPSPDRLLSWGSWPRDDRALRMSCGAGGLVSSYARSWASPGPSVDIRHRPSRDATGRPGCSARCRCLSARDRWPRPVVKIGV